MTTLDRYIARQYLFNVVALLVVLFSFVVAVDVALNIDRFLDAADRLNGGAGGGAVRRMALLAIGVMDLWWPRLLQLYQYMVGLVLVAAMGFTFTQLARHRELVAVMAGGISLHRAAAPVLAVALVFLGLKVVDTELVLSSPRVAPLLTRDQGDIGKRTWADFPVRLVRDADNRVLLARTFDPTAGTMEGLTVWIRDAGGRGERVLTAERATWDGEAWALEGASVRALRLERAGLVDALGRPEAAPARLVTDLGPEALKLKRYEKFSESLSWGQISELLRNAQPEVRAKLQRVRWSRVSQVVSVVLSLAITMPFFLVREPRNMLVQSLKSAPIGIVSLIGGVILSSVAWPGLPPGFAVFIPVIVLAPVAAVSVSWLRT
jgi:lipopolysaccharide export system permease protein